jgi:hypothetical protein
MSTAQVRPPPTHIQIHTIGAHKTRNTPWYDNTTTYHSCCMVRHVPNLREQGRQHTHGHGSQGHLHTNVQMHTPVTKTCIEQAGLARECQTSSTHMHTNRAPSHAYNPCHHCASLFAARSGRIDQHWEELAPMSHTQCSIQAHTCRDNGSMQDKHPDVHTPMRLHKDQPACMNRLKHTSHTQCVHTVWATACRHIV